jgi:hypothetical protein
MGCGAGERSQVAHAQPAPSAPGWQKSPHKQRAGQPGSERGRGGLERGGGCCKMARAGTGAPTPQQRLYFAGGTGARQPHHMGGLGSRGMRGSARSMGAALAPGGGQWGQLKTCRRETGGCREESAHGEKEHKKHKSRTRHMCAPTRKEGESRAARLQCRREGVGLSGGGGASAGWPAPGGQRWW